jgi:apolipoprotein D and lipocalin family protein
MTDRRLALPTVVLSGLGLVAGAALGVLAWELATRGPVGNAAVPEPAKPVDPARYVGLWYEIGRYENRFERGCEAVTAEYRARDDGLIDVINRACGGSVDGPPKSAIGRARPVSGSGEAKLKVSFFGHFYIGDYWVLDHADDYTWSIVGEPSGRYLWLLAREPSPPQEVRETLFGRAGELGYDVSLIRTTQHAPAVRQRARGIRRSTSLPSRPRASRGSVRRT